jgi:hypothetical protein
MIAKERLFDARGREFVKERKRRRGRAPRQEAQSQLMPLFAVEFRRLLRLRWDIPNRGGDNA